MSPIPLAAERRGGALRVMVMGTSQQGLDEMLAAADIDVVPSPTRLKAGDGAATSVHAEVIVYVVTTVDGHRVLDGIACVAGRAPTLLLGPGRWPYAQAALAAGAAAYIANDQGQVSIDLTVAAVRGYRRARPVPEAEPMPRVAPSIQLSPREREALLYIANGYTHQQAAARMGVTKPTVDTFLARARAKLGVGNKAELTLAAMSYLGMAPMSLRRGTPASAPGAGQEPGVSARAGSATPG